MKDFILSRLEEQEVSTCLTVAAVFFLIGAIGKCITKTRVTWEEGYLGPEAALAAASAAAIYGLELGRQCMEVNANAPGAGDLLKKLGSEERYVWFFFLFALVVWLAIVCAHMVWEKKHGWMQRLVLIGLANTGGLALLAAFAIIFKRL